MYELLRLKSYPVFLIKVSKKHETLFRHSRYTYYRDLNAGSFTITYL
jgi:hypothetical protein